MDKQQPLRVAVIGGDGTGPEVVAEAVKVFKAVAELEGIAYEMQEFDYGGDRYLRTGEVLPKGAMRSAIRMCRRVCWSAGCCWSCVSASTSTSICAP